MLHRIAFSMLSHGNVQMARRMKECGLTPEDFFERDVREISDALGLRPGARIEAMHREEALRRAEQERKFAETHGIRIFSIFDTDFPPLLADIDTPPVILYEWGECDLRSTHILSVVGTRRCTAYGVRITHELIEGLAAYFPDLIVVSGLALGIDREAHTAALETGVRTIGVLAHGLDRIYPAAHRELAVKMRNKGGALLTEYPCGTQPLQGRFLERNRIVAALSQGVVICESDIRGGGMATARNAASYGHEVMAIPGRVDDDTSRGCNLLIRTNRASMVTVAADIMETLGWQPQDCHINLAQRNLFPELSPECRQIHELLRFASEPLQVDVIAMRTGMPIHKLSAMLADMEFDNQVVRHPGNRYSAQC